jgi:hypothetical protein
MTFESSEVHFVDVGAAHTELGEMASQGRMSTATGGGKVALNHSVFNNL